MHTPLTASDLNEYRTLRLWLAGTRPPPAGRVWRRAPSPSRVYQDDMARFHPQLAWLERGLFRVLVALMVGAGLCCVTGLIVYVWIVAHRHLWIPMSAVAFGLVVACLSYRCLCGVIARALGHGALWSLVVMAVAGTWVD